MKHLLLVIAISSGMGATAQTDVCNLDPGHAGNARFMPDLLKADPNTAGVFYFPKATQTDDTTWKWIIYRTGSAKDIPTTDTFIHINDFRITTDGKIAVVGQLKDRSDTSAYKVYGNGVSYSVWQNDPAGSPPAMTTGPVLLNATYRQYRFDRAGYLGVTDQANTRYYFSPDGTSKLPIDATLSLTAILSPIYQSKNGLYCIAADLGDTKNITYTLCLSGTGGPLTPQAAYKNLPYLAHLQTGKFLMKSGNQYSVFDPDLKKSSVWLANYQRVGNDSILLSDDKKTWFFVDDNMDTVRLCVDPSKDVRLISHCPGKTPALVIRYTDDSLSLCAFASCKSGSPTNIGIGKTDTLIPLFQTTDSLYYLVYTTGTKTFKVNAARISGGNFTGKVKTIYSFTSDKVPSTITLTPIDAGPPRKFLLTTSDASGLHSATSLSFAHGSGTPTADIVTGNDKAYQLFMPGDRFLCSTKDQKTWTAWDMVTRESVPIYEGIQPMQIDRFYTAPCSKAIFYYTYVLDNTMQMGRYEAALHPKERPAKKITPTQTTNKKRNAKQ